MVSCSSLSDWDVSKIIDKTENWLFNEEDSSDNNELEIDENNDEEVIEEYVQEEEAFPDINDVPSAKPELEQIDESFFESEEKEVDISAEPSQTNQVDNIEKDASLSKKNISAILEIRKNIRLKLTKMLLESDPPIDKMQPVTDKSAIDTEITKVAIIQFPDNSIIPDTSAEEVLDEIIKFKGTKKLRLVGHSSKTGSETTQGKRINMEISISRAQTIKNMLINKGFDGNNIEVIGKGDLEPLQIEAEKFGEAINRRVEVFFISN